MEISPISIAILDKSPTFREALAYAISQEADMQLALESGLCSAEFLKKISKVKPDVLLLDFYCAEEECVGYAELFRRSFPGLRIIALTMKPSTLIYKNVLRGHLDGYLLKRSGKTEIVKALRQVRIGGNYISKDVLDEVIQSNM